MIHFKQLIEAILMGIIYLVLPVLFRWAIIFLVVYWLFIK